MPITATEIKDLLNRSNVAVEEAVLRIYERQTRDEQDSETTVHHNGVGFNGFDAEILTSFAKQILQNRYGKPKGFRLSEKQMAVARKKMIRYTRQLIECAEEKAARQQGAAA